ncbi:MAG: hypothetical protein HY235_25010 [Acidobacteria bacterium]|nr:hypothetical protein [Acidobacteriota bacterium]
MLLLLTFAASLVSAAEIRDVMKSAAIDAALSRPGAGDIAIHERPNFAIVLRRLEGKASPSENRPEADEFLWIRRGRASIMLDGSKHEGAAGDFVHIPRGSRRQIDPGAGRVELVAVRILATGENLPPRAGFLAPRRMTGMLKKADIDATIAKFDANQPLHAAQAYTINYVIYPNRPGPWEAHRGCVDIYFLQQGTAKALLGGEIEGVSEESPGEIRGTGMRGSREHAIGPGDLVVIPRNGAHHMMPSAGVKLAYLLMKVWAE